MFKKITNLVLLFVSIIIIFFMVTVFYDVFTKKTVEQREENHSTSISGEIIQANGALYPAAHNESILNDNPSINHADQQGTTNDKLATQGEHSEAVSNQPPTTTADLTSAQNPTHNGSQHREETPPLQNALPPIPAAPAVGDQLASVNNGNPVITFPVNDRASEANHSLPTGGANESSFPQPTVGNNRFPLPSSGAPSNFPSPTP